MNNGAPAGLRSFGNVLIALAALVILSFLAVPGSLISGSNADGPAVGQRSADDPSVVDQTTSESEQAAQADRAAQAARSGSTTKTTTKNFQCAAGKNGGKTDKGVSGNRINLAATNVRSGQGESFLGTAWVGMQAVVNKVNAEGGICGRQLSLRLVDDAWVASTGSGFIKNFTEADYFALPVVPSSEGLTVAIENGTIKGAKIPVIGTDGMLKEQYFDPYVWPVAAATVTQMRVMAKHAIGKGARTCGIVYDTTYRFGAEGAEAFKEYANANGCQVKAYEGIPAGQGSYGGNIKKFNDDCALGASTTTPCDFVVMLLEPGTASTWISGQPFTAGKKQGFGDPTKGGTSGAQPLFNERFGRDCGAPCDEMLVWTGYNPPIGGNAGKAGVAKYVNDVRSIVPDVDVNNQFLEGAYLGMTVFVEALKTVGPNLTRPALKAVMDQMTYSSDLNPTMKWSPTNKFANCGAQAFRIVLAGGSFGGFGESGTGFIPDPQCGKVPN